MRENLLPLTRIRENMGQQKLVFLHILRSVALQTKNSEMHETKIKFPPGKIITNLNIKKVSFFIRKQFWRYCSTLELKNSLSVSQYDCWFQIMLLGIISLWNMASLFKKTTTTTTKNNKQKNKQTKKNSNKPAIVLTFSLH